jgi:uncharacterized protein (UPF0332 family)
MKTFDWQQYLEFARAICGHDDAQPSRNAGYRSGVSRAYYAAFCHARNYARDNENFIPTGTAKDHRHVKEHFERKGSNEIADILNDLRGWRNQCDYADTVSNLSHLLANAISQAEIIFQKLPYG